MATDDFTLDVETFIEEVKKYPEIWNTACEQHKDRRRRSTAWRRISATLYENFRRRPQEQQDVICQKYMSKWRNIRDQFYKTLKKRSRGTPVRPYIYAKHLSFLLSASTLPVKSEVEPEEEEEEDEEQGEEEQEQVEDVPFAEGDADSCLPPPAKLRRDDESNVLNQVTCSYTPMPPEPDEDKAFFDSLVPLIKSFSMDQILEFRIGVLNLIKSIRWSEGNQMQ